ncbi:UBC9 SUMO-conjugating enzyme UBC9 [Candida maltosa Xu316]
MSEKRLDLIRLQEERKQWRKSHPFGFFAKPVKTNGTLDLKSWTAGIPGKEGTIWEGGLYPVTITFPDDYPQKPPKVQFPKDFYHPNVYPSGTVCLDILNDTQAWKPSFTLTEIVLGLQELLNNPNPESPASNSYVAYTKRRDEYEKNVREQAKKYTQAD